MGTAYPKKLECCGKQLVAAVRLNYYPNVVTDQYSVYLVCTICQKTYEHIVGRRVCQSK